MDGYQEIFDCVDFDKNFANGKFNDFRSRDIGMGGSQEYVFYNPILDKNNGYSIIT